jgi:UDP-N-acetylglucosamine/UDP-N-acetyl-alpha-D-glucosaminouronate 4-epimerase
MYLVTGGAGFIGANLVEALARAGERVRVFDNFSTGTRDNLRGCPGSIEIIEDDLRDTAALQRALRDVDYVFHQAALRSVPRSVDDPVSTDAVNTHGTLQVLTLARAAGVKRVVYASSSSVYGDNPVLPKREEDLTAPISPYAVSKLSGELYCRVFSKLYAFETVSLRYFNVFGPKQRPESKYAAVVPLFIRDALHGEPAEIHGEGTQSRDFTFIDNVVQANLLAMRAPGVSGEVFNVGCGDRHSVLEIVETIERLLGRPVTRRHTPSRAGDVRHTQAAIDKARRLLGYEPKVGFEDGMRRTVEYFRSQSGTTGAQISAS